MTNALFAGLRAYFARQTSEGHVCRIVREAAPEETLPENVTHFEETRDVQLVEGSSLQVRDTGFRAAESHSEFRFFMDGVQYSHLIGYVDNIPLVHHLSAAVVLRRDPRTRALRLWRWSGIQEALLIPEIYLSRKEFALCGVPVEDTTDKSKNAPPDTVALRALAHSKSQRLRRQLEVNLIRDWLLAGEEGWLMVDGPLMLLPELPDQARHATIAGIIKSFGAQFFQGEEQLRVLTLPAGSRTTLFQLPRGSAMPPDESSTEPRRWYSWYVRVRDAGEHEADFGLLRVETPPDPEHLAAADAISRWLIAERAPLSTPDPRWGNLLYPIHACERYLRSAMPQRDQVHLLVQGGGRR